AEQVRTAPVGSTYVSTDGAGVGAWVWRRRPTGWVVVDGDTGWRDVTAWARTVNPGMLLDGYQVRLCGGRVDLRWRKANWALVNESEGGFKGRLPVPGELAPLIMAKHPASHTWTDYTVGSSSGTNLHAYVTGGGASWMLTTAASAHLSLPLPAGTWPLSLPGTPT
uniref:hypothetical protein n=1 Tax=Actinomyces faecalis TaxID=2722820 RepID=UPI001C1324DF